MFRSHLKTFKETYPLASLWIVFATLSMAFFTTNQVVEATTQSEEVSVRVGFGDKARLGKWTPVFIQTDLPAARFAMRVLDGDDVPVVYEGDLVRDEARPGHFQAWCKVGRSSGELQLKLFDDSQSQIAQTTVSLGGENKSVSFLESTRSVKLTIEAGDILKRQVEATSRLGGDKLESTVISVKDPVQFPAFLDGLDSVDMIVAGTSDPAFFNSLTKDQLKTLEGWVANGGTIVFSATKNAEKMVGQGGPLANLLPGTFAGLGECTSSKRIEAFAESREQLITLRGEPLSVVNLSDVKGRIALEDRKSTPLVVYRSFGLGRVIFLTFDFDSERLVNWKGWSNLISRVLGGDSLENDEETVTKSSARGSSVSHFGYDDLVGQLRVPLEQFTKVRIITFTWVALLIGLYILCVGPGDYFFLSKLTGKMELTWITFPLLSILFCGIAIWLAQVTRPEEIQINQFEIVDVNAGDGSVRGSVWANVYSPVNQEVELSLASKSELGFEVSENVLSWQGLPGDGLGGMMTRANPGLLKTNYQQVQEGAFTRVTGLQLQESSTKPMFANWRGQSAVSIRSRLKKDSNLGGQLTGTVTNPFEFTLTNVRLMFENYAYVLTDSLEPGATFDVQTEASEKTLRGLLTRRIKTKNKDNKNRSTNSPWDPEDTRISRIADIMMFYDAAGGKNYTGLTHDYQSFIDLSSQLNLKRAILVGEVQSQSSLLEINGESAADNYDSHTTIVRIVLPVEYLSGKKSR